MNIGDTFIILTTWRASTAFSQLYHHCRVISTF